VVAWYCTWNAKSWSRVTEKTRKVSDLLPTILVKKYSRDDKKL